MERKILFELRLRIMNYVVQQNFLSKNVNLNFK